MNLSLRPDSAPLHQLAANVEQAAESTADNPAARDAPGAPVMEAPSVFQEPTGLVDFGGLFRPMNFLRDLPPEIDGGGEGWGWSSDTTVDGKNLDRTPLAISTDGGVGISREVTWKLDDKGRRVETMDQVVIRTGGEDDVVHVSQREDGSLDVTVNGQSTNIVLEDGQELAIRTGGGDDKVTVESNVEVNIDVDSGDGDDVIVALGSGNDRIEAGNGDDTITVAEGGNYVDGGRGDDTIIATGGDSAVYGGYGEDTIIVTGDNNYIDAGRGNDNVTVTGDTNVIGGGRGNDTITSNGDNTIYTGRGGTAVHVHGGDSTVYGQFGVFDVWHTDTVAVADGARVDQQQVDLPLLPAGHPVNVEGSQEFQDRVESDLDFLEASPAGQQMFEEFRQASAEGHEVTITELENERNGFASASDRGYIGSDREGQGTDATIRYNTEHFRPEDEFHSPVITLYHEMSHAYNYVTGTLQPGEYDGPDTVDRGVNNRERQAVGLETSNDPYDFDGDPSTPPTTHNPDELTENGLRDEFGVARREAYRR